MSVMDSSQTRFIGLDVHKHYVMVGAVDAAQTVVMRPQRFNWVEFERWQQTHIQASDAVVLEATTNAWHLVDQLRTRTAAVSVANPLAVKWIAAARVKTDGHDTLKLARLLAAGLAPAVWVPSAVTRALRALVAHRRRLLDQRTQARNRLQSILQRHNLAPPDQPLFADAQRPWWQALALDSTERLLVAHDLAVLDNLAQLIPQADGALYQQSVREPWVAHVPYIVQQTGIGVLTAMIVLAAVGDISRFERPERLVGYAGLGASIHASGQTHQGGGISKQGRRELRAALVEAAWVAIEYNAHWRAKYTAYTHRMAPGKAAVAIARQLLVSLWYLWHQHHVDRFSDAEHIARKFMTWAEQVGHAQRDGLSATQFVRRQLDVLGIGHDLSELRYGSHVYRLPPSDAAMSAHITG